jgi:hypothetical protein
LFLAAIVLIVFVAVARLPETLVSQLERGRPLSEAQAGWVFRLMFVAALLQAAYGGFVVLRPDRVRKAMRTDPKVARMDRPSVAALVARNAAGMIALTVVYGLAAAGITGERGGFWLFALLAVAQGAYYYRESGVIARWLELQPEPAPEVRRGEWNREPPDYCPPLARGLEGGSGSSSPH